MTDDKIKLLWSEFDGQVAPFARTIEARVLEELRKQEPVAYVSIIDDDKPRSDIIDRELPPLTPLYAAPTPPTPTPSQEEALAALHTLWINKEKVSEARLLLTTFILARPDTEVKLPNFGGFNDRLSP